LRGLRFRRKLLLTQTQGFVVIHKPRRNEVSVVLNGAYGEIAPRLVTNRPPARAEAAR
jgi:hypothetical protein